MASHAVYRLGCLLLLVAVVRSDNMYCEEKDCYEILGLTKDASLQDIKRAYRTLSLQYHPDKNRDPNAIVVFREVANAYEVLSDPDTRKEYDYSIEHPEDYFANRYRYYRYRYHAHTNPYYVVGGLALFATVCHYLYWYSTYLWMRQRIRDHPQVRKRMEMEVRRAVEVEVDEADGGDARQRKKTASSSRKREELIEQKVAERLVHEDVSKYAQVAGWQGRPPTFWDMLVFWVFKRLWRLVKDIYWLCRWLVKFTILKHEYGPEERDYITAQTLDIPYSSWIAQVPEEKRTDLIARELWKPANMKEFRREMRTANRRDWR